MPIKSAVLNLSKGNHPKGGSANGRVAGRRASKEETEQTRGAETAQEARETEQARAAYTAAETRNLNPMTSEN